MNNRLRKRLSYRLARNTVLLAMAVGLVLNMVQVALDYFSAREAMNDEIRALLNITHSPASQIAYNIDVRLAEELLEGLLQHPATIDARIIDDDGNTLAAASRSSPDSGYRWLSDLLFEESRRFVHSLEVPQLTELPLGKLQLTIDTYYYGTRFLTRAAYTLFSGFIKSILLSMALLVIFYFLLTRPMLNVIGGLSRVKPESPEKVRLPIPERHQEDEIGIMVGIINEHLQTIDSTLEKLRLAESAMKDYSNRLEREVEDRTREISEKNDALQRGNRALVQAKEDAVRRARARANFLASMSHEIRTPLNGVLGMLGLALESENDEGQRNRLEIALAAGQSLLGLLNDILDISKVEAGKLNLENIPFSLRDLAEECATLHAQQARRKGIDVVADITTDLPETYLGDPTRVRQVLNNLLSNAIKFTESGRVTLRVGYFEGNVRIEVIDTGIGMSKQGLHRIFSPFSQADTDTTRLYGGTGLGLTLCRQLVERMHGQIMVDSEENRGTHFTVTLPLPVEEDGETGHDHIAPELREIGVSLALSPDNPHRQSIESQLRAWGIPIHQPVEGSGGILMTDGYTESGEGIESREGPGILQLRRDDPVTNERSRVTLLLPLRRVELYQSLCKAAGLHRQLADKAAIRAPGEPGVPSHRSLDILLVEDNQVNQMVARGILRKLGHYVSLAENGKEAIDALRSHRYDLVLMDCQMPVMDGYQATRKIRENPDWKDLPIIAVTANVMLGDRDDCIASGMNDYITKPYNREELQSAITHWTAPNGESSL